MGGALTAVRLFTPKDRQAVRRIACDTADNGNPCESFFHDRELLADLLTAYYTDGDPRTSWVADNGGTVVGYLIGCLDSRRHVRTMARRIVPWALLRGVGRGVLFHADTWRLVRTGLAAWAKGGLSRDGYFGDYPAHVHINVRREFRGQGLGGELLRSFLRQAEAAGVPGVHLATRADNASGMKFFEREGFVLAERSPSVFPSSEGPRKGELCVYVKRFRSGS